MTSIVTTAEWRGMEPKPKGLSGPGNDTLRWGEPRSGDQKSGYSFTGGPVEVQLDGTEFVLGTFRHENYPVSGVSEYSTVHLRMRVDIPDSNVAQDFDFEFAHHETPNDPGDVDDVVHLPRLHSCETVEIDGKQYAVIIIGFKQGGRTVRQFVSPENAENEAELWAKIVPAEDITVHTFQICNPDSDLCVGEGWFSYIGQAQGIDIAYACGGSSQGPGLLYWEYRDPLVGILTIRYLQSLYFTVGADGACRFAFNAFTTDGATGISTGFATNQRPGLVNTRRSGDRDEGGSLTLTVPKPLGRLCPPRQDGAHDPGVPAKQCHDELERVKEDCQREKDGLNQQIDQLERELEKCKRGGGGGTGQQPPLGGGGGTGQQQPPGGGGGTGQQQPPGGGGGTGQQPPPGGGVDTVQQATPGGGVDTVQQAPPSGGGRLGDEFVTTGWALHHPGWTANRWGPDQFQPEWQDDCVYTYGFTPQQGNCLFTTSRGRLPQEPHKQSWLWRFEKTSVDGEYLMRPVPTDLRGTALYATAPATPGNEWFFANKTCLQPRSGSDSQVWKILSSPSDPYAIAILPKNNPGYFLAGNWARNGWPYLKQGSPASAHRWNLRRVSSSI